MSVSSNFPRALKIFQQHFWCKNMNASTRPALELDMNPTNICLFKVNKNKVWNVFKVNNKDTRTTSVMLFYLYCFLWTYFTFFSSVSIVDFELVNICWEWNKNMFIWRKYKSVSLKHLKTTIETLKAAYEICSKTQGKTQENRYSWHTTVFLFDLIWANFLYCLKLVSAIFYQIFIFH